MSVRDFFSVSHIRETVVEFLKKKADFERLHPRYKKPFRAHIHKEQDNFFASDGKNSIKCMFSKQCSE